MEKARKIFSLFLAVILMVSIVPATKIEASAATAADVVNNAKSRLGQQEANGMCLAFVNKCFTACGCASSTACCAYKYGLNNCVSTSMDNIPVGAVVLFSGGTTKDDCGNYAGHAGLYIGDGYMIHTCRTNGGPTTVTKSTVQSVANWAGYSYMGWRWHGNDIFDYSVFIPSKPVINMNKTYNQSTIAFTWNNCTNTTHYNIYVYKKNGTKWDTVSHQFYVNSGMTLDLEQGEYKVKVQAYNKNYWTSDGSDWLHTESDEFSFSVITTYTVSYNANGGNGAPGNQTKTHNVNLTLSSTVPTRTGYAFQGWATSANATSANYQPGSVYSNNAAVTLYAVWKGCTVWSDWTTTKPSGEYETATQYRYRDKDIKKNGSSSVAGYTQSAKTKIGSTSYSAWTAIKPTASNSSDSAYSYERSLETKTAYQYSTWYNSSSYNYYWYNHSNVGSPRYLNVYTDKSVSSTLADDGHKYLSSTGSTKLTTGATDSVIGYIYVMYDYDDSGSGYPQNGKVISSFTSKASTLPLYIGDTSPAYSGTTAPVYRIATDTYQYTHYKWGDWSGWSTTAVSGNDNREVQTRTVYRYKVATQHTFGGWTTTKAATCTATGTQTRKCSVCGITETGSIPALGHSYGSWVNDTAAGVRRRTCSRCSNVETETYFYNVAYNANGGSGAPVTQIKTKNTNLALSSTKPTRTGYTFQGWATSSNASSAAYQPGGTYTANAAVTLYAVWKANTYRIQYNLDGGSFDNNLDSIYEWDAPWAHIVQQLNPTVTQFDGSYGESDYLFFRIEQPTREGYIFDGWEITGMDDSVHHYWDFSLAEELTFNSKSTENKNFEFHNLRSTDGLVTFTAKWKPNTYTVSYDALGGHGAPDSQIKTHGSTLTLSSAVPTRNGYIFKGWSESATAISPTYLAGGAFNENKNTILYAVWEHSEQYATYNKTAFCNANKYEFYNSNYNWDTAKQYAESKGGHLLTITSAEEQAFIENENSVGNIWLGASDAEQEGVWKWITGESFNYSKWASGEPNDYYNGEDYLSLVSYSNDKNLFWNDSNITGSLAEVEVVGFVIEYDDFKYTVSYNANGGDNAPEAQSKTHGVNLTLTSAVPSRDKYIFTGWATSADAETATYAPGGTYTANSDLTLYAVWQLAHTHSYTGRITTPATCIEDGVKTFTCTCGDSYTEPVAKLGHIYSTEWTIDTEPTCTKEGLKTHHCIRCSARSGATRLPVIEHPYGEWIIDTAATCTEDGAKHRVCTACKATEEAIITKLGHTYSTEWTIDTEPTCTKEGLKTHHCIRCSARSSATKLPKIEHTFGEWIIDTAATCISQGTKHRTCSKCGFTENEVDLSVNHVNTIWITEEKATCTEEGLKVEYCLDCSELVNTEIIPAAGHSFGEWITDTAPTCTKDGTKHRICTVCKDVENGTVAKLGHTYSTEWTVDTAATCTKDGSKSHHCIRCENKSDVTVIPATGHLHTEWRTAAKATCTEEGLQKEYCLDCKALLNTEVIPALGHRFVLREIAGGHPHDETYECIRCGETKQEAGKYSETCPECNFTVTTVNASSVKISGYSGSLAKLTVPAEIGGKTVIATATGSLKANTALTEVKFESGIAEIGSLTFMNCSNLEKAVIPESVTTIGTYAFYGCDEDFTIYCYGGSAAHTFAEDNGIAYVIMDIGETEKSAIDYTGKYLFTNENTVTKLSELVYTPAKTTAIAQPSFAAGSSEYLGTGSVITVFANNTLTGEYTVIVDGDLDGDSVSDVLDAALAERIANGHENASAEQVLAATGESGEALGVSDYAALVNKVLAK